MGSWRATPRSAVVTAPDIIDESANVVQVVPLTSTIRAFGSEVDIHADETNGLEADSRCTVPAHQICVRWIVSNQ
jgi:mRNA-degrading endonuclease toxin of MazEF toxin-antitoxin module